MFKEKLIPIFLKLFHKINIKNIDNFIYKATLRWMLANHAEELEEGSMIRTKRCPGHHMKTHRTH